MRRLSAQFDSVCPRQTRSHSFEGCLMSVSEWFARFFANRSANSSRKQKKKFQSIREDFAASLGVMRLESRRVLNAAALPLGPPPPPPTTAAAGNTAAAAGQSQQNVILTVDAAQTAQKQNADIFVVKRDGNNVNVSVNGNQAAAQAIGSVNQLQIKGSGTN